MTLLSLMQKTQTVCLVILATLAIGFSLFYLKTVLLPFVISVFIVIGCRPVLEFVESRLKLHRYVAFAFSFLIGLVLLLIFSLLTWVSIDELATNSDAYRERMNNLVVWVVKKIPHSSENQQPSDPADPQDPKTASFTEDGIDLLNDPA
ncbi:MAG: AI-2E family transporter, partial [Pirellulaceae bacterium]|nr:AI-2E family transporter [Pirellulaceae bacterium]